MPKSFLVRRKTCFLENESRKSCTNTFFQRKMTSENIIIAQIGSSLIKPIGFEIKSADVLTNKSPSQHMLKNDELDTKPFGCSTCGKTFRLSSTLCRHKIIHTSQRPHKCFVCLKSFNRSSTLKTHMRTHNNTKEFMCKICNKGFHQKGNLRNHVLIHTGEKPYTCHVCKKSFNKLSNLKFHLHRHTDQKPYRCRFCKTSMTRRGELKQHIALFHVNGQ